MQDIVIKKINKNFAQYVIFGTTVDSPLFQLQEISEQIKSQQQFNVLFDQLLQTGDAENRFLLLHFNGQSFDLNTAKNIENKVIDNEIRKVVADFLRENELLLKYSVLVSAQKELIMTGGIL